MKQIKLILITIGVVVIVGSLIFFLNKVNCNPAPIHVGKETTLVTIKVHDTITVTKNVNQIVVQKVQVPGVTIHDTINGKIITVPDSTNCYTFDETEKDGAYIKAQVCAHTLPLTAPDLHGSISYKAPPETTRVIKQTDTVQVKIPWQKDWKSYALGLFIAIACGFFLANSYK